MLTNSLSRRKMLGVAGLAALRLNRTPAQVPAPDWAIAPIGWPDLAPGDGFRIGHGFACENTWFASGWWHTGEDWYAEDRDTAGATVYAVAGGEVVYADFSYPGRVVIIQHGDDLYSMYGHLEPESVPEVGALVQSGMPVGRVLQQADIRSSGQAPSHLHFEVRTFFTQDSINGSAPQFGVNCGFQCPPGPGYWPIEAAEHPARLGWRNPTHACLERVDPVEFETIQLVSQSDDGAPVPLFDTPAGDETGVWTEDDVMLREIHVGESDSIETSAEGYEAWCRVEVNPGEFGWLQMAAASNREQGADGRPSAVERPVLLVSQT